MKKVHSLMTTDTNVQVTSGSFRKKQNEPLDSSGLISSHTIRELCRPDPKVQRSYDMKLSRIRVLYNRVQYIILRPFST